MQQIKKLNWRGVLARLPLPMLALAASYGVYRFAGLFVPEWVAVIQAAAFETTYIGLAVTIGLDLAGRRRATTISLGAVVASIIYNTLAGWFHAQPDVLIGAGRIAWLCLAILHGAPLAWVAFLVANLLLHQQDAQPAVSTGATVALPSLSPVLAHGLETSAETVYETVSMDRVPTQSAQTIADRTCKYCGMSGLSAAEVARHGRQRKHTGQCQKEL